MYQMLILCFAPLYSYLHVQLAAFYANQCRQEPLVVPSSFPLEDGSVDLR